MSIEITEAIISAFGAGVDRETGYLNRPKAEVVRAGLAAVLALPEVRQAIHDDVRRETERKLRDLGVTGYSVAGWDQ